MDKKKRKSERGLEEILEGLQELLGWQAELVREGLRQVRQGGSTRGGLRPSGKTTGRRG